MSGRPNNQNNCAPLAPDVCYAASRFQGRYVFSINRFVGIFIASISLVGCHADNTEVVVFDTGKGNISLSSELEGKWEKVCILTPYSTKEQAAELLGFEYDVLGRSSVGVLDGITLLITIEGSNVVGEYEVPRDNADFTTIGSKCLHRENSNFSILQTKEGRNELKNT